jgi:DNA gyrase subunit A
MARRSSRSTPPSGDGRIIDVDVSSEMQASFLEYAYSVIYSRALPDARDGLKPVQRRILFQMGQMGLRPERGHVKSARVVGEVMGRLHPHGDSAIYDALVRMAQPFSLRLPMIDGHGNFGSPDDGPAAMRYTEARLATAAMSMTATIDEETVDFIQNYDGRETEPVVLPAALPNLLVNGASGIAVGMATNLVPHNLIEVIGAARYLLDHPAASLDEIMRFIPGPDLPGGGVIVGLDGVRDAYATGRGSFKVRARTRFEQVSPRRQGIVVTELPLNIGPERVIERMKDLVQSKKLLGIADVADLTDGESGLNLVIEIKNGFNPDAVLEQLFKLTPMEDQVSVNAVALVEGQPRTLGIIELLQVFLDHRIDVVRRRSIYRRKRAQERLHLVAGLLIAIVDIDEVIQLIRESDDAAGARDRLMQVFDLSIDQTNYILDMPLRRLTKFSLIELETEAETLRGVIDELNKILDDEKILRALVSDELQAVAKEHGTPRRTLLMESASMPVTSAMPLEVDDEPCVVLLSSTGLLARTEPIATSDIDASQRAQHDVIISACVASTRGEIGIVTTAGRVLRLSVLELPNMPPVHGVPALSAGAPVSAFLDLPSGEQAIALTTLDETGGLLLVTAQGKVKRVVADVLAKPFWEVIRLDEGDDVVGAMRLDDQMAENYDIAIVTNDAQVIRFPATSVRPTGRAAGGMAGIKLNQGALAIAGFGVDRNRDAVVVTVAGSLAALPGTDAGTIKVSDFEEIPAKGRGTGGVRSHKFRSGEDTLTLGWVGPGPARAASAAGVPIDLPQSLAKRDATGTPGSLPIAALGGQL